MLSKCANPECSEVFRYLHQGKIFLLSPTPNVQAAAVLNPSLYERFWLCTKCSKQMTLVWGGAQVKLVRLPVKTEPGKRLPPATGSTNEMRLTGHSHRRAAAAGRGDE